MIPDRDAFIDFMKERAGKPLTARDLAARFKVDPADEGEFFRFIMARMADGDVVEVRGGRYVHPSRVGLVVGRLQGHPDGFGFVVPDDPEYADLFIKTANLKAAMHTDRVVARVEHKGERPSGRVIRILKRGIERVVGKVAVRRKYAVFLPLDDRIAHRFYVPRDELGGAADGQLVQIEITEYPSESGGPEGRVLHVLGYPDEPDVEAQSIALKHNIAIGFDEAVLAQAEKTPKKVRAADRRNRRDLRKLGLVTIDGEKARDFDDAICVEEIEGGFYRLYVAIADVSHYVKEGSLIDVEALARGNSTYFPDRVFPMLPETLSNGICSLNPGVERLAMVAELTFSRGGRRKSSDFYPAVIKSKHRLTYTEVGNVLDDPDWEGGESFADTVPMLRTAAELARLIRARRKDRGSIDFDLPEAEIILDLTGKPEDIVRGERNWAHFSIEEFMIGANEAVAEYLRDARMPCPYRIHEEPEMERVDDFRQFIHNFGYTLKGKRRVAPSDFQKLAALASGKPEERMINHMMLRTMKKAVYDPANVGHFGLASECYAHFTSPIRRYPDLILHRHLKKLLAARPPSKKWRAISAGRLEELCPQLSNRERMSEGAEREAVQWKKCQFMADKVGTEHWGFITGTASFGFFVELEEFFVDGLVHVSSLQDDFYHFSEELHALLGEKSRRRFQIGDRVKVRVDRVDVEKRRLDFALAEEGAHPAPDQPAEKKRRKPETALIKKGGKRKGGRRR